ncbi:MAG: D-tyrosyl-tRNA(Tyr) deacylase [Bacteroidetes bacterium]|nr:D-tyrosyl-tRNA(Tyr) deacylase [Bacteroidota bacterium]
MICLAQRVSEASVEVDSVVAGSIGGGLLILLGVHRADTDKELEWLVHKCANLRIFRDDEGRMNRSLLDVQGEALVVSQFTLYANTDRGNRPSFIESAPPELAEPLYERFAANLSELLGKPVPTGIFGAEMNVRLVNDGPVTIWLERKAT